MFAPFVLTLVVVVTIRGVQADREWERFKEEHGRKYPAKLEDDLRRAIFLENKRMVERHNQGAAHAGYTMKLNHLSDRTTDELAAMNGLLVPEEGFQNSRESEMFFQRLMSSNVAIPDSLDWRKVEGRVSEVKNQGDCGSCWAFSATGALEGQMVERKGKMVSLSEQNLVDCSDQNTGCFGGNMYHAWEDINKEGGINAEHDYPYRGYKYGCFFNKTNSAFNDKSGYLLPARDEVLLMETVAKFGPVSVGIDANQVSFMHYQSGVYYEEKCSSEHANHAVLVVGYGTDPKQGDYWIVKNSWGDQWGEEGFVKMARNKNNHCCIASMPMIPTF